MVHLFWENDYFRYAEAVDNLEAFVNQKSDVIPAREQDGLAFFKKAKSVIEGKLQNCDSFEYAAWCISDVQAMILMIMAKQYGSPESVNRDKTQFEILAYKCFESIETLLSGKCPVVA